MNLFNPSIYVKIGKIMWRDAIDVDTSSSVDSLIDWAKLSVNESILKKANPTEGDLVDITIGYEGKFYNVFAGNVDSINGKSIICKDDMLKLHKTKITATFSNSNPQDIINYCLDKAQITSVNISTDNFTTRKLVVINNKTVIEVLKQINKLWNINYKFYFMERYFYWIKEREANIKAFSFVYGTNIISLKNQNGWVLEAVASPFIKHSDIINIVHPKLSGNFTVKKIVNKYYEGYTRSYIYV